MCPAALADASTHENRRDQSAALQEVEWRCVCSAFINPLYTYLVWVRNGLQVWDAARMSGDHPRVISWPFPSFKIAGSTARTQHHSHVRTIMRPTSFMSPDIHPHVWSVCIRDAKEAFSVKPRFQENFRYLVLDVEDSEEQNLIRLFPGYSPWHIFLTLSCLILASTRAKQFIYDAIAANGRVLVHCNGELSLTTFRTCFERDVACMSCSKVASHCPRHLSSCSWWSTIIWVTRMRCTRFKVNGTVSRPMADSWHRSRCCLLISHSCASYNLTPLSLSVCANATT
jgi:hypothetical protein